MSLSEQFAALMDQHDLASISVTLIRGAGDPFWTGSAQAIHGNDRLCGQEHGETPEAALTASIKALNGLRAKAATVPMLEAA